MAAGQLSERQFAARIGVPQPTLDKMLMDTDVNAGVLCAILQAGRGYFYPK